MKTGEYVSRARKCAPRDHAKSSGLQNEKGITLPACGCVVFQPRKHFNFPPVTRYCINAIYESVWCPTKAKSTAIFRRSGVIWCDAQGYCVSTQDQHRIKGDQLLTHCQTGHYYKTIVQRWNFILFIFSFRFSINVNFHLHTFLVLISFLGNIRRVKYIVLIQKSSQTLPKLILAIFFSLIQSSII